MTATRHNVRSELPSCRQAAQIGAHNYVTFPAFGGMLLN